MTTALSRQGRDDDQAEDYRLRDLRRTSRGKAASIARLGVIADDFEILQFDTRGLIVQDARAGVEIFARYRHRETGVELSTTIANFWTFEDGWPVRLSEYHDLLRIQEFKQSLAARV